MERRKEGRKEGRKKLVLFDRYKHRGLIQIIQTRISRETPTTASIAEATHMPQRNTLCRKVYTF